MTEHLAWPIYKESIDEGAPQRRQPQSHGRVLLFLDHKALMVMYEAQYISKDGSVGIICSRLQDVVA